MVKIHIYYFSYGNFVRKLWGKVFKWCFKNERSSIKQPIIACRIQDLTYQTSIDTIFLKLQVLLFRFKWVIQ